MRGSLAEKSLLTPTEDGGPMAVSFSLMNYNSAKTFEFFRWSVFRQRSNKGGPKWGSLIKSFIVKNN